MPIKDLLSRLVAKIRRAPRPEHPNSEQQIPEAKQGGERYFLRKARERASGYIPDWVSAESVSKWMDSIREDVVSPSDDYILSAIDDPDRLPDKVFDAEFAAINDRRKTLGLETVKRTGVTGPHPGLGLVGLALSGGGIRSATFNLGVLQALQRFGALRRVDYMSTVSGGGFIGASLSVAMTTAKKLGHRKNGGVYPFPFPHHVGTVESAVFRHLRDYSRYLVAGGGLLNTFRIPALFLRGLAINFLILTPSLLIAVLFSVLVSGPQIRAAVETRTVEYFVPAESGCVDRSCGRFARYLPVDIGGALLGPNGGRFDYVRIIDLPDTVTIVEKPPISPGPGKAAEVGRSDSASAQDRSPGWTRQSDGSWLYHQFRRERDGTITLFVAPGKIDDISFVIRGWNSRQVLYTDLGSAAIDPVERILSLRLGFEWTRIVGLILFGFIVLFPVGQWLSDMVVPVLRAWWRTFSALWVTRLQPAAVADGTHWAIRDWTTRLVLSATLLVVLLLAAIEAQPMAIYLYVKLSTDLINNILDIPFVTNETVVGAAFTLLVALMARHLNGGRELSGQRLHLVRRGGVLVLGIGGPLVLWMFYLGWCKALIRPTSFVVWVYETFDDPWLRLDGLWRWIAESWSLDFPWVEQDIYLMNAYGTAAILIWALTRVFYDVNKTSFHRFYRDRLSKAYLFDPWDERGRLDDKVDHCDQMKLSEMDTRYAPYHLINATLNIQRSKKANLRGRNGVVFLMSKYYTGCPLTSYRDTAKMEAFDPNFDLATAMAISGAAASPNMGRATVKGLTFLLALLNIRLGYWLPNPDSFARRIFSKVFGTGLWRWIAKLFRRVGPFYLLLEMVGWLNEESCNINVSDGGHLENLGIYELIRRRCKVIIVSDAEADPQMHFGGLAQAVRLARIDFGVTIDIDPDPIRRHDPDRFSNAHFVTGTIDYGNNEVGRLIYLKSSLTGDENVYIREYHDSNESFPHQTTTDQFFDEEQFEAYRALGYHIAREVFVENRPGPGEEFFNLNFLNRLHALSRREMAAQV